MVANEKIETGVFLENRPCQLATLDFDSLPVSVGNSRFWRRPAYVGSNEKLRDAETLEFAERREFPCQLETLDPNTCLL